MSQRSGFIAPGVHVNMADPSSLWCFCHEDPKALCPRWREYGITEEEHTAALAREQEDLAILFPGSTDEAE